MSNISIARMPIGIFRLNNKNHLVYVNKAFCTISGYPKSKLLGDLWLAAIHQEDLRTFLPQLIKSRELCRPYTFQFRFTHFNREEIWVLCHIVPENKDIPIVNFIGTITDISELKNMEVALQKLTRFDPLTEFPNRYFFNEMFTKCLIRAKRNNSTLALLFINLDYFKKVNDFYGHDVGDLLLKEVGNKLKQKIRVEDFIARIDGDEFAIILEDIDNISTISFTAQRFLDAFNKPFPIREHEITLALSIGISVFPDDGDDNAEQSMVQHAEQALLQARESNRNCYRYFNKTRQQQLDRYMLIVQQLQNAIRNNQFELYYQPKIHAEHKSLVGMEALLRWNNPLIGPISPAEFIIIAEDAGLMNEIGAWVIKTALNQFKLWYEQTNKIDDVRISINLSPAQLNDSGLIATVSDTLKNTNVPTKNILFEITETAVMKKAFNPKSLLNVFFMELGIGLSIDDFGTGYSSFTYLKQYPIKELKIDKSFVDDIGINKSSEMIIKAIISLAMSLNLEMVAEGVETQEQFDYLKQKQCNIIQGYYFSKPLSTNEMTAYIQSM
jgi:diguanylate cyclase (GGDEF)-like protein/PAS domain S-box-containing protein